MLVNPQRMRGFFPPVYHEDWLCIMDHLRFGEVAIAGKVAQLRYHPFTTTARTELEEFGDILASGLLWLVHTKRDSSPDGRDYWREATKQQFWCDILQQRATLLDELYERLHQAQKIPPLKSIQAARERCHELSPEEFVSFMEKWRDSLAKWRTRLSDLPKAHSVAKALSELGLLYVVTMHDERRSLVRSAARRIRSRMDAAELPRPVHLAWLRVPLSGRWRRVRTEPSDSRLSGAGPPPTGPQLQAEAPVPNRRRLVPYPAVTGQRGSRLPRAADDAATGVEQRRSAGRDRRLWLGRVVVPGGGAGGRAQRPPARSDQAEQEDRAAAAR
jgi:hypothetical protein